ncbi:MAG: DUF4386 family protein [Eubacteriales bacterium]
MSGNKQNVTIKHEDPETQWKSIIIFGAVTAVFVILGTLFDIIMGMSLGADLTAIPNTAIERFLEFDNNWLLGLYHLDMLNLITGILMIPTYFALYTAHRRANKAYAELAFIIFIIGTAVFISNNSALSMLELSKSYNASTSEMQRTLFTAAGEAILAKSAHGSLGVFPGFALSTSAGIIMSVEMLKGKVFGKATAYIGITGGVLLLAYLILVTFIPNIKTAAIIIATPGGLLSLAWIIMFTVKLFKMGIYVDNNISAK